MGHSRLPDCRPAAKLQPMDRDQTIVLAVLIFAFVFFVWGRWRYDAVALMALLTLVIADIVPGEEAFVGFGHPAVVTVGGVLIVSRGLQNSGAVDVLAGWLSRAGTTPTRQILATSGLTASLSAFMNNVGALAVLLPTTIRLARNAGNRPSIILMPLAFASLLGGLTTLVGTPPNIVIATFRADTTGEPFAMFDFAPVGLVVAVVGIAFIASIGWRLIPTRDDVESDALFEISDYLFEVRVPGRSKIVGKTIAAIGPEIGAEFVVAAIIRGHTRNALPWKFEVIQSGDVLAVRTNSDGLQALIDDAGVEPLTPHEETVDLLQSDGVQLAEAVLMPDSPLLSRSVRSARLRQRYGLNLLGVSRRGRQLVRRLGDVVLQPGDVVLLQGRRDQLTATLAELECLPLAERGLQLGRKEQRSLLAVSIFGGALVAAAAFRLLPIEVAIAGAATIMGLVGLVSPKEVYQSIDWTVIVLLAAMIPVGGALESTGAAKNAADAIVAATATFPTWGVVAVVLIVSMFLSDIVNNTAAAVLMAPIAVGVAAEVNSPADPFLMAVAVGASAAFLTPIGHQSNLLVMGPGGYSFGDYWRMGLPLELLIVVVAVPMIMLVW